MMYRPNSVCSLALLCFFLMLLSTSQSQAEAQKVKVLEPVQRFGGHYVKDGVLASWKSGSDARKLLEDQPAPPPVSVAHVDYVCATAC
ncbi:hypothetical protein KP509_25G044400 [Ceratopteris richardii]|uniref:Uncharacterized protein n=1 Tax=Ceratopteris richardii TaxID=49495 RepID=A0A8T2RS27_CERRI|nr:hypothetical protein KP509_25G044400 [Ceratopteris richardii]